MSSEFSDSSPLSRTAAQFRPFHHSDCHIPVTTNPTTSSIITATWPDAWSDHQLTGFPMPMPETGNRTYNDNNPCSFLCQPGTAEKNHNRDITRNPSNHTLCDQPDHTGNDPATDQASDTSN